MNSAAQYPLHELVSLVELNPTVSLSRDDMHPFVAMEDISPGRRYVRSARTRELTGGARFAPGDTLLARITPCLENGKTAQFDPTADRPGFGSTEFIVLRARPGLADPAFVFYLATTKWIREPAIASMAGASGRQRARLEVVADALVPSPPLQQQRRIASILGAYDDLIEVNRRRIAVLEEMARRLFEEWYVVADDGWPSADEAVAAGRDATIGEVIRFVRGRSYRSADLAESGGLPFVNLKCMLRDGGFRRDGVKRFIGEYKPEQLLRTGDIVLAVTDMTQDRRIVGQAALIPKLEEPAAVMSMDMVKAVPSASLDPLFCYYWLRFSGFAAKAAQHANGANVLHLSPAAMAGLPIRVPPLARQEQFSRLVQPMTDHAQVLALAVDKLAASRDLLLPRLISGDLPVTAAERELEAVA